jgi:hypothetical protein
MSKFRLDEVDHQILDMLIDNTPFTDIAKNYLYLQELYMSEKKWKMLASSWDLH